MKKTLRPLFPILLAGVLASASSLDAQDSTLQIDPARTTVEFTLGALLHTVHGTFQLASGRIGFDPATGRASGELVVDATSGQSGNAARDKKMHGDVLESARFPRIVFRPDRGRARWPSRAFRKCRSMARSRYTVTAMRWWCR